LTLTISTIEATALPLPANASTANPSPWLSSVICAGAASCTAIGGYEDENGITQGLIETESGGNWAALEAPLPPSGTSALLSAVACPSVGSCVATGYYVQNGDARLGPSVSIGLIEMQSGSDWTAIEMPDASSYPDAWSNGIACPAVGSCVAVGSFGGTSQPHGFIMSESGSSWTVQPTPVPAGLAGADSRLNSIACPTTDTCTAVGVIPAGGLADGYGLIVSESVGSWTATVAPDTLNIGGSIISSGTVDSANLGSIACSAPGDCLAVGEEDFVTGNNVCGCTGLVEVESAGTWSASDPVPADAYPQRIDNLSSATCTLADCTAVGDYNRTENANGAGAQPWIINGDGTGFGLLYPSGGSSYDTYGLESIGCSGSGTCVAVGGYLGQDGLGHASIIGEAGQIWTAAASPLPPDASATVLGSRLNSASCPLTQPCTAVGGYASTSGQQALFAVSGL
jgi:hypothetical protein